MLGTHLSGGGDPLFDGISVLRLLRVGVSLDGVGFGLRIGGAIGIMAEGTRLVPSDYGSLTIAYTIFSCFCGVSLI